tara:strand:+ start:88 stop:786 length:699 start_codon:yes stop_codon:yes gene_type:complete
LEQRKGYLLIADISGFTKFIKIHDVRKKPLVGSIVANYWESHAEALIKDLIEVIIAAFEPCMKLNKIEGDAAFFFLEDNGTDRQADAILEHMETARKAFNKRLKELIFVESCPCDPCQQSKNLKLKIVVHYGTFHETTIRNFSELSGKDVILVHRLLKNSINLSEYWIMTKQFSSLMNQPINLQINEIKEKIDDFGKVSLDLVTFESETSFRETKSFIFRIKNFPKMLLYYR